MGLHSDLEIYKVSYDLMAFTLDLIVNMPRPVKPVVGARLRDDSLALFTCIQTANMADDKTPHLLELQKRLEVANILFRLSRDKRYISTGQYARAVELTTSIGKQATAWRKQSASSPVSEQPRLL